MRWINLFILTFVLVVLQVGVAGLLGIGPQNVTPDLLLLTAVIIAFIGKTESALLACWVLGLAKDLTSDGVQGSYALCFGLIAILILQIREFFYGESPFVLMAFVFAGSFLTEKLVFIIEIMKSPNLTWSNYSSSSSMIFFSALFTAALAPFALVAMQRLRPLLGLPMRRGYRRR